MSLVGWLPAPFGLKSNGFLLSGTLVCDVNLAITLGDNPEPSGFLKILSNGFFVTFSGALFTGA